MSMDLIVTRPAEDAPVLCFVLKSLGHHPRLCSVIDIHYDDTVPLPPITRNDALAFTSVNGVRAFARRKQVHPPIPAFAVGAATAEALRQIGFSQVHEASGDSDSLAELIADKPPFGALIHIAGRDRAGDLASAVRAHGIVFKQVVAYRAQAMTALPEEIVQALETGASDGVLIFSSRTAEIFLRLAQEAGVLAQAKKLTAYCLSPKTAVTLIAGGFEKCHTAPRPTQSSVLSLITKGYQ